MMAFKPGDVILSSKSFAHVITAEFRDDICDGCFRRLQCSPERKSCPPCNTVTFCADCTDTKDHFHFHQEEECPRLVRMGSLRFFLGDQVRMLLRVWLRLKWAGGHEERYVAVTGSGGGRQVEHRRRSFQDLMDHAVELERDSPRLLLDRWTELSTVLEKGEMPSWKQFVSVYGKILVNSFSLRHFTTSSSSSSCDLLPPSFGCGLFLSASILDHSCAPNAVAVVRGNRVSVVATEEVGSLDEVRICYTNNLECSEARRRHLASVWFFSCRCALCAGEDEREESRRAVRCAGCGGGRPLRTGCLRPLREQCGSCGAGEVEEGRLGEYRRALGEARRLQGPLQEYEVIELEACVGSMRDLFHPLDEAFLQALLRLHSWHWKRGDLRKALDYGVEAVRGLEVYDGCGERTGVLHFRLAQCLPKEGGREAPRHRHHHLSEAKRIFETLLPWADHTFWTEEFWPIAEKIGLDA